MMLDSPLVSISVGNVRPAYCTSTCTVLRMYVQYTSWEAQGTTPPYMLQDSIFVIVAIAVAGTSRIVCSPARYVTQIPDPR